LRESNNDNTASVRKELSILREEEREWFEKERQLVREEDRKLRESVREKVMSAIENIQKEALSKYTNKSLLSLINFFRNCNIGSHKMAHSNWICSLCWFVCLIIHT
jgi:hypothetical protein